MYLTWVFIHEAKKLEILQVGRFHIRTCKL